MPATLTLGANSYELTDNTDFGTQYSAVNLGGSDNIAVVGSVANYGLNTSTGADTLTISATFTGNGNASSTIATGGNSDSITIGGSVNDYIIDAGSGNDTLIIAANASGTTFFGSTQQDSIILNAGVTITGGTIQGGTTANLVDADTIVLSGAGVGTSIASFSKAFDTLVIGASTINSTDLGSFANTTYSSFSTAGLSGQTLIDITALNGWLAAGSNTITLI
jgi:hypothetical protein